MDQNPNSPRVSLRDIGKILGVSHVTVSLALRNNPRISAEMRGKVQQTALELGYQPDPMLAALAQYRKGKSTAPITAAIAWINTWQPPEGLRRFKEFDAYWTGASQAAAKFGYRIEEFRMGGGISPERLHQILTARGITGILLPPQNPTPDWGGFPWEKYSTVRFGRSLKHPRTHLVTSDQVANTMLAFEEMQKLGYKRIGFITNEANILSRGHLFEGGYLIAQRILDPKLRLPVLNYKDFENAAAAQQKSAILTWYKKNQPDGIITDVTAVPALLEDAGLRVPDDVGLAVTTVLDMDVDAGIDQHPEEIGRVGFLMLNSLINDGSHGIPEIFRQNLVEGSWVHGKTMPRKN